MKKKKKFEMSGYSSGGASYEKPTLKSWLPSHYSSKSDTEMNLRPLRDRAFDLAINSPLGAAIIATMLNGTVGSGLKLYPQPKFQELGISAETARDWSRRVQLEFEMWANSLNCDFYHRNNFYELQRIAFQSYLTDGDCFCLFKRRYSAENPYTLRLQLLESQRVSNPVDKGGMLNNVEMQYKDNRIINGIEIDKFGRLQAIWVSNQIWNEPTSTTPELNWQRVRIFGENSNRNVLHICYDTRADQFRGVSVLAPVIENLKQIARFSEAELSSAIIKSFFSLFFVQQQTNFGINDILPEAEGLDLREYKLGSGTLNSLPRGIDVKSVESNNAQSTFDSFFNNFVKQAGAAVGIPFEVLMKSFTSSYSASRAALIQAEETFKERRAAFINDFLQPIYENFLIEAVSTGRIFAHGFFNDPLKKFCWCNCDWRRPVMPNIDSVKEANAATARIKLGISSKQIEATRIGNDFYNVCNDLDEENKKLTDNLSQW